MSGGRASGSVADGFEAVVGAFVDNIETREDAGASCAVWMGDQLVVDLWTADDSWEPTSRSCLFSVSKGVTTLIMLMAVERGQLDLDAPVITYWPEYGQHGKAGTTVRQLLAHRAGLLAADADLTREDLQNWNPVARALADSRPAWQPGGAFAYHALTVGYLAGEVLRRATGRRPAQWLSEEIAEPLGLGLAFGADPSDPDFRPQSDQIGLGEMSAFDDMLAQLDPLAIRAFTLGGGGLDPLRLFPASNDPSFLGLEMPAANLVGSARDCARLYAVAAGGIDGQQLLRPDTIRDAMRVQSQGAPFVGIDEGIRWGTGFMLDCDKRPMLGPGSFGHDGAGGQLAFGHLDHHLGFGYQTTRPGGLVDERSNALCRALQQCL